MAPKELNFITGNKNKLAEVQAILAETPVKLQSQAVDLVEIQGTIEEISTDKARRAAEAVCFWFSIHGCYNIHNIRNANGCAWIGWRTRSSRGYVLVLRCFQRATWTLCVRYI
jgi:hypothetical protein